MSLLSEKLLREHNIVPHQASRIQTALHQAGVAMTAELSRILDLPRRPAIFDDAHVEDLTPLYATGAPCLGCPVCRLGPPRLWPIQSAMLWDAHAMNGLFASVAVGAGKTLVTLLLPDAMGAERAVLLLKPSLRSQFWNIDVPSYGRHFRIARCLPSEAPPREPGLHVVAYSELSSAGKADILDMIQPDLVIADEAHHLRHRSSARTKRFLRYMKDRSECRLATLTGTPVTRSLYDYAHLIELVLRKNSPLPGRYGDLRDWAAAIDDSESPMAPGKLMLLCVPGEGVRQGFRRRVVESRGVVATTEGSIGTSLVISARRPDLPERVQSALGHLRRYWEWDGSEFEDGMAVARVARQLACGFFYRWDWPGGRVDREWLEAKNAWHREIRARLKSHAAPGMDSPLLLARAAAEGRWDSEAWPAWSAVRDRPEPPVTPIWIDDFLVRDALTWGAEQARTEAGGGIVWYEHDAVGRRLGEVGLPFFGAGPEAAAALDLARPDKDPVIVCSLRAHGTGRNLQAFSQNLVVTPPANGTAWEQMVGRTHRSGQGMDEVGVEVYLHTEELEAAFEQARKDAVYVEQTQGQRQKLLFASLNL